MRKLFFILILFNFLNSNLFADDTEELIKKFSATKEEKENGAVIVKKEINITLDKNNKAKREFYYLIAILDDNAANDYSHIKLSYNSYYKNFNLDFAKVITQNGEVSNLKKDAISIKNGNSDMHDDIKVVDFSLPKLKKNSFIAYKFTIDSVKQLIPNQWSEINFLSKIQNNQSKLRVDTVRDSILKINLVKNQNIYFDIYKNKEPIITTNKNITTYFWQFKNLKKYKIKPLTKEKYSDFIPNYKISTMNNWSKLTNHFSKVFYEKIIVTDKLKKLSLNLTKDSTNFEDKIKDIYHYMQNNIKYIMANFNSGGFTPHFANEIYDNLYGDCKDQTILFVTLLKAIGIEAYPTLVNSSLYSSLNENNIVSSNYFDHMIVYIPKIDRWIDTVGYKFKYPGINSYLIQQPSLIIKPTSYQFKKINERLISKINVERKFYISNSKINLDLKIVFSGEFNHTFKSLYKSRGKNLEDDLKMDMSRLYPSASAKDFKILNKNSMSEPFTILITYNDLIPIDLEAKTKPILQLGGNFDGLLHSFINLKYISEKSDPEYGFDFSFPYEIIVKTIADSPTKNSKAIVIHTPKELDTDYVKSSYNQDIKKDSFLVTTIYKIKKRYVDENNYKKVHEDVKSMINDSFWQINYQYDPFYKDISNLTNKNDLASKIKLAETYLDSFQLDKAKNILKPFIDSNTKDYKINYLYGVILGLLGEDILSEKYLSIADEIKNKGKK